MFSKFASWFGWNRIAILTTTESIMQLTANAIKLQCESNGQEIIFRTIESTVEGSETNQELLQKQKGILTSIKDQARSKCIFMLALPSIIY